MDNITIFSIPKPFIGQNIVSQRNAVKSWLSLDPKPSIYLLGDEEGIEKICDEFNIIHIKNIRKNIYGTPLISDAFETVQNASEDNIFIFINTDIILNDDVYIAVHNVCEKFKNFLIIGHRHDVQINHEFKFNKKTKRIVLNKIANESGYIQNTAYKDYFIFSKNIWKDIPDFAVGRASYDNALVYKALRENIPVIDASNAVLAIHQNHDYGHLNNGKNEAYKGVEAKHNYVLGESWVGQSVVGMGYIDSSTWYIDNNYSIKNNGEERRDKFRQVQLLYYSLKKIGWDDKYESYSKKIEYVKFNSTIADYAISIIVVSWRLHPDTLKNFEILQQQRDQNFELIFVNNGADDEEFKTLEPFIDTYVKLNDNTGPCFARNFGAVFAKAPILCFLEDDGIPESNFVKSHLFAHNKYEIHACFGSYFPKTKNPLNSRATHYFRGLEPFPCPIGLEGNTSIKSKIFYSAGGWDEDIFIMRDGLALSLRIARFDNDLRKIIYFPYSLIYHDYAKDVNHFVSKMKYRKESQKVIESKYFDANIFLEYWKKIKKNNCCLIKRDLNIGNLFQDKKKPLVSIILKTIVCGDKLIDIVKSVESVEKQSYSKFEFVVPVCIDSNTDRLKISKKNIRLIEIQGEHSADIFNRCIEKSHGDYLLFIYPKDLLVKNALETFVWYSFLFSKVDVFYSDSNLTIKNSNFSAQRPIPEYFDIMHSLLDGYPFPEPLFFIKKELFIENGYYDTTFINHFDYEFLTRIAVNKEILFKRIDLQFLLKLDSARIKKSKYANLEGIDELIKVFDILVKKSEILSLYLDYNFVYDVICQSSESELEDSLYKSMERWKLTAINHVENKRIRLLDRLEREMKKFFTISIDKLNDSSIDIDDTISLCDKNLNIAMLTPYFWPTQAGMEMVFHNLASIFTRMGHKVILFAPEYTEKYAELDSNYQIIRYTSNNAFLELFKAICKQVEFDVIFAQSALFGASLALQIKNLYSIPVVLRLHGEDIQTDQTTGYGWRLDPQKNQIITSNIQSVETCIAISNQVKSEIKEIHENTPVIVINNGIDTLRFSPQKNDLLTKKYNLHPDAKKILMVGRNVLKKSFHLGLEAFASALENYPGMILFHAGKDGNGVDLIKTAERLGIANNFVSLGPIEYSQIHILYNSCDIFLFPSKTETFGNVSIEAMACGLPCIEFDYGANHDKIINGVNGYIVPYGNTKLMGMHILELATDNQKLNEFSKNARQHVIDSFTWDTVAEKYISVFKKVKSAPPKKNTLASIALSLKQNPLDVNLAVEYLSLLISKGDHKEAINILKYYLGLLPQEKTFYRIYSQLLCLEADAHKKSNQKHKALGCLEAANLLSPGDSNVLTQLGEIYLQLDQPEKAFRYLKKLKDVEPGSQQNAGLLLQAGEVLEKKATLVEKTDEASFTQCHRICLASDLFGPKNGNANGPAFSRMDTLTSLMSYSNNVSVLTTFTPSLPDAIIEYISSTKVNSENGLLSPEWYLANDNPHKKNSCIKHHMRDFSSDLIITDGVRLGPHRMLQRAGYVFKCPKVFIHRASPVQYSGLFTNNDQMTDALLALDEYEFHVSVSSRVMEEWKDYPALADKKWYHIPNCAREEEAQDLLLKDRKQVRSQLGLPINAFVVTCLASIQKRKGQDILLSLMPEIVYRIPSVKILLVGPLLAEWGGEEIISLAQKGTYSKHVEVLGPRYDALEIVYASDCLVLPSREEALPRSILEAMTLKTPIVASNVNGIPELIDDEVHGLLFSHSRPRELAKKIGRIAEDKELSAELSQNAHSRYWQNFSRAHHAQRWKQALDMMLG